MSWSLRVTILSEGGLAVAAAEMTFAGGLGADILLDKVPVADSALGIAERLFSESNTRFLCEVDERHAAEFEQAMSTIACEHVGTVTVEPRLQIFPAKGKTLVVDEQLHHLKESWQQPLRW